MIQQEDRRDKHDLPCPTLIALRRRLVLAVALVAMALGCATARPERPALLANFNPFVSRLDALVAGGPQAPSPNSPHASAQGREPSTFCMEPLPDSIGLGKKNSRLTNFQSLLVEELQRDGFHIVDPHVIEEALKRALENSEPIYDPHTGRRSEFRARTARSDGWEALALNHGCEFFLSPHILRVSASWINGRTAWDGASERVMTMFELFSDESYGYVEALSLHIRIVNRSDDLIYFGTGGIQLLAHLPDGFEGEYRAIEPGEILANPVLNRAAIRLAIRRMRKDSARSD